MYIYYYFITLLVPLSVLAFHPSLASSSRSHHHLHSNTHFPQQQRTMATAKKKAKLSDNEDSPQKQLVSLEELLSSCIDASLRGCDVIRKYKQDNATTAITGTLKEAGEAKSVVTQADIDAQDVIVEGLRNLWGDALTIVGEEDDSDEVPTAKNPDEQLQQESLRTDLLKGLVPSNTEVPIDELTLFIDPLDGTREFVEGRVQNVGCLIGVARNGKAILGAVGLPFPDGISSSSAKTHYAINMDDDVAQVSHHGVYPVSENHEDAATDTTKAEEVPITIFTGDSKDPVLSNATNLVLTIARANSGTSASMEPVHTILGGTTSKFVAVALKERSIAVLHFKTCYWDTCAPEPVLNAMGGKVTDFFGSPLVHRPTKRYDYGNLWGVVASAKGMEGVHDALCAGMRADIESVQQTLQHCMGIIPASAMGPQATDISRDLDGHPLTRKWLEAHILQHYNHEKKWILKGYGVPESQAVRGLMSNGARLILDWEATNPIEKDDEEEQEPPPPPSSVFYKRIVMSDLAHARAKLVTAPHKIVRDVHSYQVESGFLGSRACQEGLIKEAGVQVCNCYGASKEVAPEGSNPRVQLESKFAMTLEDFKEEDGWYHEWLLEEESCKATLKTMAKMHAYFWTGSNFWKKENGKLGSELEETVWPNGGYMQPALQGIEQLKKVATGWKQRLPNFKAELSKIPELKDVNLDEIGARVEKLADEVGTRAHPYSDLAKAETTDLLKYRTLIHGDPKQANLFFRKNKTTGELDVGLIDFQWCGFGLAATDVCHHICAALQPHCLSYDGEKEKVLLDYYHSCLTDALIQHGVAPSVEQVEALVLPRAVLQEQYEVAFLDTCRMVFAYAWARWKPESEPSAASFNRNAYNKSLASVLWFITRGEAILSKRGL